MPTFEQCYRAVESRDSRFDGWIYIAVTSTGIYCRPSCPAMMPKPKNCRFFPTAAACQEAGFRACRRCQPDAVPGSPDWDLRADAAARAMRLVNDGVVERDGVAGLAARLGYTTRHLGRVLTEELGAGPLALARARRAHTARLLLQTTSLSITEVAFAAGFGSVRQFNDTIKAVFAATPSDVRNKGTADQTNGSIVLRLPYRQPYDAEAVWQFFEARAVPGLEEIDHSVYRRAVRLHHGTAVLEFEPMNGHIRCALKLTDLRDLGSAVARARRLLHLDADPAGTLDVLGGDELLGPLVRSRPGLRVPGSVDPFETAVRAVIGQQVSLAAARTVASRLVMTYGEPLAEAAGTVVRTFPSPEALAGADPEHCYSAPSEASPRPTAPWAMPRARSRTIRGLAAAVADGEVVLDAGVDRADAMKQLLALPGIGPWTAEYVALRGLGDPDAFPGTDLGIRHSLVSLGIPDDPSTITALATRWKPLRSYAAQHLWTHIPERKAI